MASRDLTLRILGFKYQSAILAHMFQVGPRLELPIFDVSKYPQTDNRTFLNNHMLSLLSNAFPHLQKYLYLSWSNLTEV